MQYYYVTYVSRNGEYEFREGGVLSGCTMKQAEKKAQKAKRVFERYGWERYCVLDSLREISVIDYGSLKKYLCNIDRFFDEDGELRE